MWPMAVNDHCPSVGAHLLGGCAHKHMRSLYIHRHNQAMQTVPKAFAKGKHGSYLIIADVGRAEELAKLRVIGTRITSELPPDSLFPGHLSPEQAQAARNKPRSDILVIKCSAREAQAIQKGGALRHRKGRQVWVVDGGYGSNTNTRQAERKD